MPPGNDFGPLKGGGPRPFKGKPGIMGQGGFTPDPFPKKRPPPEIPDLPKEPLGATGAAKSPAGAAVVAAAAAGLAIGGGIYEAAGQTGNPVFDALDKLDRKLRGKGQGKPGKPKGGTEIEPTFRSSEQKKR